MQTDDNNKNDATVVKVLDNHCGIQLDELEKLMQIEEKRKSQLRIEFNDLSYSVYHGKGTYSL